MLKKFKADAYYDKIINVPASEYRKLNYKLAIFDFDNTIARHGSRTSNSYAIDVIDKWQSAGFEVHIISNAKQERADELGRNLPINIIGDAGKPGTKAFSQLLSGREIQKNEVIYCGDQLFTDVLAANNFGVKVVLVDPLEKDEPYYIKLKRFLEVIIKAFTRQRKHFDYIINK